MRFLEENVAAAVTDGAFLGSGGHFQMEFIPTEEKKFAKLIPEELKTIPFSISCDRQQHRRRRSGSFCTDSLSL